MTIEQETNHPVDQLARVREQIKKLTEEEKELRLAVLAMPEGDRVGRWSEAVVRTAVARRLDQQALKNELGEEYLERFKQDQETTTVVVKVLEQ